MSQFVEKLKKHSAGRKSLLVAALGETIYWKPLTGDERGKISRLVAHVEGDEAEYTFRLLIEKCEDGEGNKIFSIENLEAFRTEFDFVILSQISQAILTPISMEQAEKN